MPASDGFIQDRRDFLWKIPSRDLSELALELEHLDNGQKPTGLIPPYDPGNLAHTARCLAMSHDYFYPVPVYACVTADLTARFLIRTYRGGGYKRFALTWPGAEAWARFAPTISDLVVNKIIHVAGGDPGTLSWDVASWTWSEEELL